VTCSHAYDNAKLEWSKVARSDAYDNARLEWSGVACEGIHYSGVGDENVLLWNGVDNRSLKKITKRAFTSTH
jgi:hypothetical protein